VNLRQIWTLYSHEVRSALRERNIVVYSIVLPIVMYPAILWAVFAGMSFVEGQSERLTSRVALLDPPEAHAALVDTLRADERLEVVRWTDPRPRALEAIADGELDLLVEFAPPTGEGTALGDNHEVRLHFNQARDRSATARARVQSLVGDYRREWIARSRAELGVDDRTWSDFVVTREDVASSEDVVGLILGLLVPMLMLITIALASFYPAIDATAGERERSTWETLMTVAAPRSSVAVAKYLYVATFGMMGGLLNLGALVLSLQWILSPLAGAEARALASTGIPLSALPVVGVGAALLGLFVAAGMIVFAVFARSFKEGQSMIMPFYLLLIAPALFLQDPEMEFTMGLALTPVANVVMLIREAIMGSYSPAQGAATLGSMALVVVLAIAFAQWVMSNEDVMMGSAEGGLGSFLKRRFGRRKSGGQEA